MKNLIHLSGLLSLSLLASGCANTPHQTGNNPNLGMSVPNQQIPNANQSQQFSSMSHLPQTTNAPQQASLVNLLTNQLGVSQNQAMGGAGSIFALAQQRMSPVDFSQLSQSVPNMNSYLSAVPKANNSNGLLGAAANLAGGSDGGLGTLASLAGAFQLLGMNSGMIGQFMPVVLQYVQQQGGANSMMLLQNALR